MSHLILTWLCNENKDNQHDPVNRITTFKHNDRPKGKGNPMFPYLIFKDISGDMSRFVTMFVFLYKFAHVS